MLSDMRSYYLYPLLASSLDDYFRDLLLLSFLGSMEEEDYDDLLDGSDTGSELDDDEDEEENDEEEEEEEEEEGEDEESDYEDSEDDDDEDDDDEDDDDDDNDDNVEPVPPKRRLLNNLTSQPMGAGSSSATIIANHHAILRSEQGNSPQPGSASRRAAPTQPTVSLGIPRALVQVSQRPVQLQPALPQNHQQPTQQRSNTVSSPNSHSRSQQVQTDTPENSVPRPLVRQVSQHNLPQARVVLRLPNNIGDMYPREE